MRRRQFLSVIGGAAVAWPLAAGAQSSSLVAYLGSRSQESDAPFVASFRRGLAESGAGVEKRATIEFRWADNEATSVENLAAELLAMNPAVIVATGGSRTALAVKKLTEKVPIVFVNGADAQRVGLVQSINRPEANVTGVNFLATQIMAKRLELLLEFVPKATGCAAIVNPRNPDFSAMAADFEAARQRFQIKFTVFRASDMADVNAAFAAMTETRPDALLIGGDALFSGFRRHLIEQCNRLLLPSIFDLREFAAEGGLMSYGTSQTDAYRQAGLYVGRILRGAVPADLPVLQSTRLELVINAATAKSLGLAVPNKLMALADEVID